MVAGLLGALGVSTSATGQLVATGSGSESAHVSAITVQIDDAPLEVALRAIAKEAGLRVVFGDVVKEQHKRVSLHAHEMAADEAFAKVLDGTGLRARLSAEDVVISAPSPARASVAGGFLGHVVDAKTRQPIAGVSVTVDEAKTGVTTDAHGMYRITGVAAGSHVLRVRKLSYGKLNKSITVVDGEETTVDLALEPSVNTLDQVVVTGTVVPTALKAIPNAITVITAKELQDRGITRIDQLFRGDVPGLFTKRLGAAAVSDGGGVPGVVDVSARGGTHLDSDRESIKIYVDGVELAKRAYLGLIDATAIERMEIITGPEASTIYGSNAINGVIQIFTKRGTSSRPQVTMEARSAWTQNNFNSAVAPAHTANMSLSGVDGRMSYNVGGSWGYTGSWTPGLQEQRVGGNAGERMTWGRLSLDGNLRVLQDGNVSHAGGDLRPEIEGIISGNGDQVVNIAGAVPVLNRGTSTDRAFGTTGTYALTSWWSHTVTLGQDEASALYKIQGLKYSDPQDTAAFLSRGVYSSLTAAYNTTVQVPLTTFGKAVVTVGVDASHQTNHSMYGSYAFVAGNYQPTYSNAWVYGESSAREHGGFLQSQVGLWDAVFVTYGLRAVYNPNIGKNQNPNWEPRYGIALTHELGGVTAKLRASYGTATRPPAPGSKDPTTESQYEMLYWGVSYDHLANPNLVPESQQGGEGGLELYLGTRASIQVTRYNQTVDNLIVNPVVDSVDVLPVWKQQFPFCAVPFQCALKLTENVNIGSVRNQGWEGRGTLNLWMLNVTGTYSWNKSRLIGITPKYRGQFPQYVVGAPFRFMPEHTYALGVAYVHGGSRISYNVQGQGLWQSLGLFFWERTGNNYATRLGMYNSRVVKPANFTEVRRGYLLGDLNVTQQLMSHVEVLLQINNLTNNYQSEVEPYTQQSGRTTGLGVRLHF